MANSFQISHNFESSLKWIAIGVAVIGLICVLSKATPSIASGLAKTKKSAEKS
jgi:hypothetical protein